MKHFAVGLLPFAFMTLATFETARAQFSTDQNFYASTSVFTYSSLRARTSKDEKSFLAYDVKAGYQVYPTIFLGFAYQADQNTTKTSGYASDSLNNTSKGKRASLGPTLGYVSDTIHATLTYYYESKWTLDTTTATGADRYQYVGSGTQVDLGYKIPLWQIYFGPQLSYKKYTYDKLGTNGASSASISPKLVEDNLEPSLVFYYFF